jgi:hypothetical protein
MKQVIGVEPLNVVALGKRQRTIARSGCSQVWLRNNLDGC